MPRRWWARSAAAGRASGLGRQTTALAFIVNRPPEEPGFRLARTEGPGRTLGYTMEPYAAAAPHGRRYNGHGTG